MANRRLALIGPFAPLRGGIAQFNDRLLAELQTAGHEVFPVSFSRQYPDWLFPGTSQTDPERSGPAAKLIDSINPLSWKKAGRTIRSFAPDAAVCAFWTPHLAPALTGVCRSAGVPAVGLFHNLFPHEGGSLPGRLFTKRFLGCMDAVLTLSGAVAGQIRESGFDGPIEQAEHPPYDHFGPPVDRAQARAQLGLPEEGPIVLCFGLVRHYKGFDLALRAVDALFPDMPGLRLVVAGEAYDPELDQLLKERPRPYVVREARYIPDSEVAQYYSAADLLLLPYRSATQSGALAIAAHFSLPVVVTDTGGLGDVVRRFDMGTVANAATVPELVGAMRHALAPDRLAHFRLQAGALAAQAGWPTLVDTLMHLIDNLQQD